MGAIVYLLYGGDAYEESVQAVALDPQVADALAQKHGWYVQEAHPLTSVDQVFEAVEHRVILDARGKEIRRFTRNLESFLAPIGPRRGAGEHGGEIFGFSSLGYEDALELAQQKLAELDQRRAKRRSG